MKSIYCIPKLDQISNYLDFSNKYNAGFEYNDFFMPTILDDADKVKSIINTYKSLGRDMSEDTLHGVFLDICINSEDPLIFKASDYRVHQSMDIAMQLGIKAVIFHTNHIPTFRLKSYRDGWVKKNAIYWHNLLQEYPSLCIYIENMFDCEALLLRRLSEEMKDEPRFGVCLDVAHAFIGTQPLNEWFKELAPYIKHMHINDNDGIEDSHHPVGSMDIPWDIYKKYTKPNTSVLIEVNDFDSLTHSVNYMKENGLYPF